MERYENIFYNIVKNETSLTEVFCNLMMYKSFRNTFLEFVKNQNLIDNKDKVKFEYFQTEKDFGKVFNENINEEDKKIGRGDLILDVNGWEYIFELKIEITTKLTLNQPKGYINYLKNKKQSEKDLFFILPKNYRHINQLSEVEDNLRYWEDFISLLKIKGIDDVVYIKDFIDILNYRWFYHEEFSFTENEKNIISNIRKVTMTEHTLPKIMMDLTHKVDLIAAQLKQTDGFKLKESKDEFGFGIFINETLWFGIEYKLWEESGNPLSIGIDESNDTYVKILQNKYENNLIKVKYDEGEIYYYYPLPLEIYNDTEKIKEKIVDIKSLLKL